MLPQFIVLEELAGIMHDEVQRLFYRPDHVGGTGNIFLDFLEDKPDEAVMLSWVSGAQGFPSSLREDEVAVRVRGGNVDDRLSGADLAEDIAKSLHGWLRSYSDRDGPVLLITVEDPPYHIGYDEKKRPEFELGIVAVTETLGL